MNDVQSSRHAASLLARRIEWLPAETLKLLSVGAVLGKELLEISTHGYELGAA
jgi:hypothetical protein